MELEWLLVGKDKAKGFLKRLWANRGNFLIILIAYGIEASFVTPTLILTEKVFDFLEIARKWEILFVKVFLTIFTIYTTLAIYGIEEDLTKDESFTPAIVELSAGICMGVLILIWAI